MCPSTEIPDKTLCTRTAADSLILLQFYINKNSFSYFCKIGMNKAIFGKFVVWFKNTIDSHAREKIVPLGKFIPFPTFAKTLPFFDFLLSYSSI